MNISVYYSIDRRSKYTPLALILCEQFLKNSKI